MFYISCQYLSIITDKHLYKHIIFVLGKLFPRC